MVNLITYIKKYLKRLASAGRFCYMLVLKQKIY